MKIKRIMMLLLIVTASTFLLSFDLPTGWYKAGSESKSYDMGIDKGAGPDHSNAATIKSTANQINGFGTLMQDCLPDKFSGRRIRMTALVKSKDVENKAGLWLRVDKANSTDRLAFDNML